MERDNGKKPTADSGNSSGGVPDDLAEWETADGPRIDDRPPTADDIKHADEVIEKYGWQHLNEK